MKVSQALEILTELAEKYPDFNLSVYADGAHHTRKLLFYAISPMTEVQKQSIYSSKEHDKAVHVPSEVETQTIYNEITKARWDALKKINDDIPF